MPLRLRALHDTFTAWIARAVPELELDLPATAIGKDYLGSAIVGAAPSGSGLQLSLGMKPREPGGSEATNK